MAISEVRNIVLTGFMGTGKTTVGTLVADKIGWSFRDTDDEIVERTGRTIPDIFEQDGEAAFRRIERAVCQSLAARTGLVIATGGGMLMDETNRAIMLASGLVVCLTAPVEVLAERLGPASESRPLLRSDWRSLYNQRKPIYDALPFRVDTAKRTPVEVANEVIWLWRSLSL